MSERLQKYLARAGIASRRAAEGLITAGRVRINNERVTVLGTKVEPGDLVTLDGKLVSPAEERAYYILYKPTGVVTTMEDPQGRPTVASLLEGVRRRLFPVGRLDYDAEGALLCTDDGDLAHQLTHPSFEVPRTYLAKVKGVPDQASLDKLRGGVRLEDGMAKPEEVEVHETAEKNTWLRLVVTEGRPHLIKRLCAAIGHPVVRLYRPSQGGIRVKGMAPGALRALTEKEVELLWRVARGERIAEGEITLPPRRHGRSGGSEEDDEGEEFEFEHEAPARPQSKAKSTGRAGSTSERAPGARSGGEARKSARADGDTRKPARGGDTRRSTRAGEDTRKPARAGAARGASPSRSFDRDTRAGESGGGRGRAQGTGEGRPASRGQESRTATGRSSTRNFTAERGAAARGSVNARRGRDELSGGRPDRGTARPSGPGGNRPSKGRPGGAGGRSLVSRTSGGAGRDFSDAGTTGRSPGAAGRTAGATGRSIGSPGRGAGATGRSIGSSARGAGATGRSIGSSGRGAGATGRSIGSSARGAGATGRSIGSSGLGAGATGRSTGARGAPAARRTGPAGKAPSSGGRGAPGGGGKRPRTGGGRPGGGRGRTR